MRHLPSSAWDRGEEGTVARPEHEGRLELTWTNKDQTLLAHEDGRYEWVPPADYRVAEVRLLHDAGTVGETRPDKSRAKDNLLIRGDALNALRSLSEIPEFACEFAGKIKLAYIDPPFNSQQAFAQYDDNLEHSVWLTMMRDRLEQIKELLAEDGSVWVHLDDSEMPYCRVMMDEVFGRANFVASVVWEKADSPRNSARQFSTDQDYILIYSKTASWTPYRLPRSEQSDAIYSNPDDDPRGPWLPGDPYANKPYSKGLYEIEGPTGRTFKPPAGRFWRISEEKLRQMDSNGLIWWGPNGSARPSIKRYLADVADLVPRTLWSKEEVGHNRRAKNEIRALFSDTEAFNTPKPEALMQRVLQISSRPGDIVLDCFLGSGTTAAVAHKMGRRWVGVERSRETLEDFCTPRLQKVVAGEDPGGITKALDWQGGGGFRILDVGPSMFEDDEARVVLADWATNTALSEVTAAQLGFQFDPAPPFAGHRGRNRLAVIDGQVSATVVELLLSALGDGERLTVCGTGVDPGAADELRARLPGSRVRKIPASILAEYETANRWRPTVTAEPDTPQTGGGNGAAPKAAVSGEVSG